MRVLPPLLLATAPPAAAAADGLCCAGADACVKKANCKDAGTWCAASQANCEGNCNMTWCPAAPTPAPPPTPQPPPPPPRPPGVLTPSQMQQLMGMGINLGNRIDLYQQDARPVEEKYFAAFKEKGFQNVRIPVCWDQRTMESAPYTINASFLTLVEQAVDWSLSRGMVTILNAHHEKWLDDPNEFAAKLPRLEAIWTQLATRFASKDQTLLFEIFNEAHLMSADQLNTMNAAILPIMRKDNPTRIVMIQGLQFGNPSWIIANPDGLTIPDDDQLMLEIHNYDPFKYAGANPSQHSWGSDADKATFNAWVDGIDAWSKQKGLLIYYGEFGLTDTQNASTGSDTWFSAHYQAITNKGWGASVWSDGGHHMVYNYDDGSWNEPVLKDLGRNTAQ